MPATTLPDRALLRLSGEDVSEFLQGLVTNDVTQLREDKPLWTGLLTAQGKALFDFILWAAGEDVLIDCEAEQVEALCKRLLLYRLRRPITIEREDSLAVHWSLSAPAEAGVQLTAATRPRLSPGSVPDPRLADLGHRWLPQASRPRVGSATASRSASPKAWRNWAPTRPSGSNATPPS